MSEREILEQMFQEAIKIYGQRGFKHRVGYGERPALVNIDIAKAWTAAGSPFQCDNMPEVLRQVRRLLDAGRKKKIPIVFTYMAFEPEGKDGYLLHKKIPSLREMTIGSDLCEFEEIVKPRPGEQVLMKKGSSGFHGTNLDHFLSLMQVDTVIVTGVTASACLRHTVEDAILSGYRPIIPRECVSDRIPGAIEWNLFDIDAKFGDVEPIDRVLAYLEKIPAFELPRDFQV